MTALDTLPVPIARYLAAHDVHDADAEVAVFTDDATVVDDGRTHVGRAAIDGWTRRTASEYTYTTRITGSEPDGPNGHVVTQRLEGDFPGGVVDLRYRFTLRDDRIERLEIAP